MNLEEGHYVEIYHDKECLHSLSIYKDYIFERDINYGYGELKNNRRNKYEIYNDQIYIRTIKLETNQLTYKDDQYLAIIDNKLLESEIRKQAKKNIYDSTWDKDYQDFIQYLKKKIQPHELEFCSGIFNKEYKLLTDPKTEILKFNLTEQEFEDYCQAEIQKIENGINEIQRICAKYNIEFVKHESEYKYDDEYRYIQGDCCILPFIEEQISNILPKEIYERYDKIIEYYQELLKQGK